MKKLFGKNGGAAYLCSGGPVGARPRYADVGMVQLVHRSRKELQPYSRPPGFALMCRRLLLDDFLDPEGRPRRIFDGLNSGARRQPTRDEYLHAIPQYLEFCLLSIPERGRRITQKLKDTGLF